VREGRARATATCGRLAGTAAGPDGRAGRSVAAQRPAPGAARPVPRQLRLRPGDLRAKTRSTIANGSPAPVVGQVSDAMAGMIGDTVTRALAGGPYRAEPGPCTLSIETADGAPVFSIAKSGHQEKDAVSDLVRVFVP
jgi:hypothetical protein